jgi:hypothetical protein
LVSALCLARTAAPSADVRYLSDSQVRDWCTRVVTGIMLARQLRKCARDVMPKTDYTDLEIRFPRLQARVHKTDDDAFWMQIWIWEKPGDGRGGERREIVNGKRAGIWSVVTPGGRQLPGSVTATPVTNPTHVPPS